MATTSVGQAQAPQAPRPFKVQNADGSTTTVTPEAGQARLSVQPSDMPANNDTKPEVTFLTNSAPRDAKTGYYAGAMLGFNIAAYNGTDFGDWFGGANNLFSGSPDIFGSSNSNMSMGPMAAVKFGYVWPFGDAIEQFESETGGLRLAGALEAEFVYFHGFHEYADVSAPNLNNEVQQITFAPMVNALLKAYWGRSELYVGPGIGVAMTIFDGDGGTAQDDDSIGDFAYQFILGYEFHMNEEWSIFAESKYFTIQNMSYLNEGSASNLLMGIGVKKQLF